jgi:polysaccharide export outer membrane protein
MKNGVFIILFVLSLASCKTNNVLMEPKSERNTDVALLDSTFLFDPTYQYRIRRDDKISISVWGQDELSVGSLYGIYNSNEVYGKWLMVDYNGNIEIPKVGTMKVLNLSIVELKDTLKKAMSQWILNPIVDAKVLNKKISIMGEVRNPQVITFDEEGHNLLEMVSRSGGFEFYANLKYIKVLRQVGEDVHVANIDLSQSGEYLSKNIQLYPGDIVIVPSKKNKEFDKRISTIVPFTTVATAAAILMGTL